MVKFCGKVAISYESGDVQLLNNHAYAYTERLSRKFMKQSKMMKRRDSENDLSVRDALTKVNTNFTPERWAQSTERVAHLKGKKNADSIRDG